MNRDTLPNWTDEDVFILGGGPSLKTFDVGILAKRNVIGCNDAYTFGSSVVDVAVFGDYRWWAAHERKEAFVDFQNPVVTNCPKLKKEERIVWYRRIPVGFHTGDTLGWNCNTGALAINLALVLGAKRIFLLGFDMQRVEGKVNWHDNQLCRTSSRHYNRYIENMDIAVYDISEKFPDAEVFNLNPQSLLKCFPKATWDSFDFDDTEIYEDTTETIE